MAVNPRDRLLRIVYYWFPVGIVMGFIFTTSSVPGKEIPALFPFQDILYHASIYAILSLFFFRALRKTVQGEIVPLALFTVVFCVLYGVSDELHQLSVTGRSCSGFDVAVDAAGALAGAVCTGVFVRWQRA